HGVVPPARDDRQGAVGRVHPAVEPRRGRRGRRRDHAHRLRVPRPDAAAGRAVSLAYVVAAWLLVVGLYGAATSRHLVHLVLCLGVMQSSTYVLLLAIGYRAGGKAPIFADIPSDSRVVDPVVQAMTLTDIVVEATVVAVLLALSVQAAKR